MASRLWPLQRPLPRELRYWQVDEADAGGASFVTYAIAVRTVLPGFVTGDSELASLIDTVTALRKLVERAE